MPTQTADQKAAAYRDAGLAAPISADTLSNPAKLNIPTYNPPAPVTIAAPAPIDFGVATKQAAVDQSQTDLKTALDTQGTQAAVRTQLETTQGVPDINKQLNELYAKDAGYQADLTNIASDTLKANNTSTDRLAPTFAISGEQAQIARQAQNAQQNVNIQRATNAALITAAQGRLSMANDYIQKALDAQFTPLASKIEYLKGVLADNRASLSTSEAAQLQGKITEQTNAYNEAKQNKQDVYSTLLTAQKYGADAATLQKIAASANGMDAAQVAGSFLQDPKAKYDLESARLDNILKNAQIDKTRKETAQIGQPTAAQIADQQKAQQVAKDAIPTITDKINSISSLINSPGLSSAVGTSFLTRGKYGPLSAISTLSGARQDFIAGVQQLVSKDTIDTLLNVKAQGGTFGALSDQERLLLQSAATKIGTWAIHDSSGNTTGYNVDEASFKKELQTVQSLAERARDKALGNAGLVSSDEKAAIQQLLSTSTLNSTPATSFSPASYF